MGEEKKVIRVGRRRHVDEAPPGGRERAEAPQRETGGGPAPSFGGLGGSGGTGEAHCPRYPSPPLGKVK